jgi:hypothetical protein
MNWRPTADMVAMADQFGHLWPHEAAYANKVIRKLYRQRPTSDSELTWLLNLARRWDQYMIDRF